MLAGGASRRMGRDKAFLELDGVPLAVRVAGVLQQGGCAPVLLSGNQPDLNRLGHPVLREEGGDFHPLRGVAAGLRAHPRVLFAPCDLWALEAGDVRTLLSWGTPVVAEVGGRVQPLLALLDSDLAAAAAALAVAGGSARALVAHLPRVMLPARAGQNANHPNDLPARAR